VVGSMSVAESRPKATWTAEGQEKRAAVQHMFGEIAPTYDLCNSLMSFRLHPKWRAAAVRTLELSEGDTVLDLCCGTGDFFPPLRKAVGEKGHILGLDFSAPMLSLADRKDPKTQRGLADACSLPVADASLDGITVGWGIRNVPDIDLAHREALRALKPGKRFVSVDMAQPRGFLMRAMSKFTTHRFLPLLGAIVGKKEAYTYLPKSTERFLDRDALKQSMEKAGFVSVGYRDLFFGNICIHWGVKP
jgi:demethylmenaquinone methyltransferase / 2-methoxy-6-polyprenyl-1,4-benzoquinol methylase